MAATWLIVVGYFGAAFFIREGRQPWGVLVDFTGGFVCAAAMACGMTLVLGCKRRWGFEVVASILVPAALLAGGVYLSFWLAPPLGQGLLGATGRSFFEARDKLLDAIVELAWLAMPIGAVLGVAIGGVASLLLLAGRRWPHLVAGTAMGLVIACAITSAHVIAFSRLIDLVVRYRLHGLPAIYLAWYMRFAQASAVGATAGAVVGAAVACAVLWLAGRSRSRTGALSGLHPSISPSP